MRSNIKLCAFFLLTGILFQLSCQKEFSCEDCRGNNKPPISIAGPDQVIALPTDSVLLDGSLSKDPDGKISEWQWTKISGPASFNISNPSDSITMIKNLVAGTYQFELKVTDNGGLSAKDTVQVTVSAASNRPPIANAGNDTTIILPVNSIILDGSGSTDPDNNINGYVWTKISGPSSFNIDNANVVQTQVTNLVEGVYLFELKVTDSDGLYSKDTMQVSVIDLVCGQLPPISGTCDNSIRPQVCAKLIPVGTLSQAREGIAVEAAGNKVVFAGGLDSGGGESSRVDIFDFAANTWSTAELSEKRFGIAAVAAGNKIFFAGGGVDPRSQDVDIYDVTTNTWSLSRLLSTAGDGLATAAVGNKVFFAGGNYGDYPSSSVDIYDLTTNTWSTANLSTPRNYVTAVSANNKVYFSGGWSGTGPVKIIDIYDNTTGGWSTSTLQFPRSYHAAIAVNDILYFAGGAYSAGQPTCSVETWNINTGARTLMNLSSPPLGFLKAVAKNNKILFFEDDGVTSESRLDMYDIATNTWSIVVLPAAIEGASIISVNNTVYIAGGKVNGVFSNQVWKLEF